MQLFHEMKQEFPTVPDNVVSDLVYANCHNRLGCIESMRKAAIVYPCSAQAYPSQSIQAAAAKTSPQTASQNHHQPAPVNPNSSKPPALPKRGGVLLAATRNFNASAGENNLKQNTTTPNNININNNNNNCKNSVSYVNDSCSSDNHGSDKNKQQSVGGDNNNLGNTFANSRNSFLRNLEAISSSPHLQTSISQRPTTLSVKKDFYPVPSNRPIRQAPPPPNSSSASSPHQPFVPNSDDQLLADGLNVSLNVMVSPVAGRRPPNRPPRHTSALSVQPESPFMADNLDVSPRSYTSVNFTLRQPTNSPQSPIDISAGPSLTYSSSSFDARQGYQSRLQITVGGSGGGGGGSISAMRARPRSCYNIQEEVDYEEQLQHSIATSNAAIKPGISLPNVSDTTRHLSRNAGECFLVYSLFFPNALRVEIQQIVSRVFLFFPQNFIQK
jgi:TAK1-binding protein 2